MRWRADSNIPLIVSMSEEFDEFFAEDDIGLDDDFINASLLENASSAHSGPGGPQRPSGEKRADQCQDCDSLSTVTPFTAAFDLKLCRTCVRDPKYSVGSKTQLKAHYLLTDADLEDLPFFAKPNPNKEAWGMMHLYMRSQVSLHERSSCRMLPLFSLYYSDDSLAEPFRWRPSPSPSMDLCRR